MNNNYIIKNQNNIIKNMKNKLGKNNTTSNRSIIKFSKEEKIFDINNFKKKKKIFVFTLNIFYFLFYWKLSIILIIWYYSEIYYKFMSIEVIIPFIINNYISSDINKKTIQKDMWINNFYCILF